LGINIFYLVVVILGYFVSSIGFRKIVDCINLIANLVIMATFADFGVFVREEWARITNIMLIQM
jgi:hypothetical protein